MVSGVRVCASVRPARFLCFFSSRRRHTRCLSDWSSDVCSSDLVSLFAYDNNTFVAESFLPSPATVKVTVDGEYSALRNLETGELIQSYVPEVSKMPWRRRGGPEAPKKSHFLVPLMPHSYAAFAVEK